ncbi:MAG: hypothetical protein HC887_10550 [Desulfobacteraceae bacterium]|nr:hypothetical protein [Desulfobacteraceae bacterium]
MTDSDMKCPYCGKVKAAQPAGKYKCTGCGNRFVILSDGKIKAYVSYEKAGAAEIKIPSLTKILFSDHSSSTAGALMLGLWVLVLFRLVKVDFIFWFLFLLATIASITGIIVLIERSDKIRNAFGFGEMDTAKILQRYDIKGWACFKIQYEFYGREYIRSLQIDASILGSRSF